MSRIFLSHSSKDNFEAVALGDWLLENGWDDVFLDLDPAQGIHPGERWERKLYEQAAECAAVLFLVSSDWLASDWCRREYELARKLNKRIVVVLIDKTPIVDLPQFLKDTHQAVSLALGEDHIVFHAKMPVTHEEGHVTFSAEGLARLKAGLTQAGLDPRFFAWPPEDEPARAPYRGLEPLEAKDAGVFFGRDAPVVEALDALRGLHEAACPRLFVILGASGAGKSSFLRAGLLPRLARDDNFLSLPAIRPERAAITGANGLVAALAGAAAKADLATTRAQIREAATGGAEALRPILRDIASRSDAKPTLILAVDQAEELFRAEGAAEGELLLTLLHDLTASDDPAVIALFAIRSDSLDALEHAKSLEGRRPKTFALLPMPRGAYQTVIERPAQRLAKTGRKFEIDPGLTQALLEDLEKGGGSDALPLLSFTLEQLYRDHEPAGRISQEDYQKFGRLKGAIDAGLARALVEADKDARIPRDSDARLLLLRRGLIPWLAGVDPETRTPRRRIARTAQIPSEARPLIDLLVEQRLLTRDVDAETGEATIEPAHESLLRQWGGLKSWLDEDFGLLATLEGVQRAARDWDANARAPAWAAHGGVRLVEADRLEARPDLTALLSATDRAYVATCRDKEKAAREAEAALLRAEVDLQREKTRNVRRVAWISSVGLIAALGLAGLAGLEWQSAERREAEAKSAAMTALSTNALPSSPTLAQKFALAAWPRRSQDLKPKLEITLRALGAGIVQSRERKILRGHDAVVVRAAFSQDGGRVVTASWDNTARVWDAASGQQIAVLRHEGKVTSAIFSPDGTQVVTAPEDKTARLWDAATGKQISVLRGHSGTVMTAAFSPDGRRVVTASEDETARLWDAATGRQVTVLHGHGSVVMTAAFSPDGRRVLTASSDWTARLWDTATGQQMAVMQGHDERVLMAAFSPDGKRVVTASWDRTARIWDAAAGKQLFVLRGHDREVVSASFSPDGSRVVTASEDRTARVWDAATGQQIVVLRGHGGNVWSAAFSPDGMRIVTASGDKTVWLWDAASGRQLAILRHEGVVSMAAISSDGMRVVSASEDKTARLWDAATGQAVAVLNDESDEVRSVGFSADSRRLVIASKDNSLRIWDAMTGQVVVVLRGHEGEVRKAGFSADGTLVITASWDKSARLWNAATGRQIAVLRHDNAVASAAVSPDGTRVATASDDGTARLWDAATGSQLAVLRHDNKVVSAEFSRDGGRIVTASDDKSARLWDAATGQQLAVLRHEGRVASASFSPDGTRVVTACDDKTIRIWAVTTGRQVASFDHDGGLEGTALSPDGTRIVTTPDNKTARLWDVMTGQSVAVLRHDNRVSSARFSNDGRRVVTASWDKTARLWDAATGRPIAVLRGHEEVIWSAAFSAEGNRIVTAASDKTARLWDAATGQQVAVFYGHNYPVMSAEILANGRRVVTSASDKTMRLWDVSAIPKGNLFQIACAWLPDHNLTDIARDFGLHELEPICEGDPPLPDPPQSASY
jgi:WD40 repeat protein